MSDDFPSHIVRCKYFGQTRQGGNMIFGFSCEKCGSVFRRDSHSIHAFETSVDAVVAWADQHDHTIPEKTVD
jgi:hypothetical protein